MGKYEIQMEENNCRAAIQAGNKEKALACYQKVEALFDGLPLSVASLFQRWRVLSYKKKLLKALRALLQKKGWLVEQVDEGATKV